MFSLNVEGKTLYSKKIVLPIDENIRESYDINLVEPRNFSGEVRGIPTFSLDSPLIGIGDSYLSELSDDGKFRFSTRASADDMFLVGFSFSNSSFQEWGCVIYRYRFYFPQEEADLLTIPSVGDWKCSDGSVEFDDYLSNRGLNPVRKNIPIKAVSQDKRIVYKCNPDEDGKFLLIGLPDGRYNVYADALGYLPFYSDPIEINVVNRKSEKVDVILHVIQ